MNFNPPNNLKDLVINTFQEILAEDPNFFFTDRLSILTWKSKKIAGALITKVGNRRYLGYLRKDIKGQEYWKYKPLTENSNPEPSEEENSVVQPPSSDNIAKFKQRQAKTQSINHGKSSYSESSTNEQSN